MQRTPPPEGWNRCRDLIAVQHRILVGKTDPALERLAQVYASDKHPVIRMYSDTTLMKLFDKYGTSVMLRTATVVTRSYEALIAVRDGKPSPRKFADNMVRAAVWQDIAARIHSGADIATLTSFYTDKYTTPKDN